MSISYRPDIDGLRAVAVMSVIGFHAFPEYIPGGFIGVDIFFVIAGFLITSILLVEYTSQRIDFLAFYVRRILRIFPALALMLIACFGTGWRSLHCELFLLVRGWLLRQGLGGESLFCPRSEHSRSRPSDMQNHIKRDFGRVRHSIHCPTPRSKHLWN